MTCSSSVAEFFFISFGSVPTLCPWKATPPAPKAINKQQCAVIMDEENMVSCSGYKRLLLEGLFD